MVLSLNVQADIFNIGEDIPRDSDVFLVDTNVWIFQVYANFPDEVTSSNNKRRVYQDYLGRVLEEKGKLVHTGLILAELMHVIEDFEFKKHKELSSNSSLHRKEFRHNCVSERAKVNELVQVACRSIESQSELIDCRISQSLIDTVLARRQEFSLDGYDLMILESAIEFYQNKHIQIITDDADFSLVSGIQVFTNNYRIIKAAADQQKLITR